MSSSFSDDLSGHDTEQLYSSEDEEENVINPTQEKSSSETETGIFFI